jgi:HNH endonuclease/AP2 domain
VEIPLTRGRCVIVDDDAPVAITQNKWCVSSSGYAHRSLHIGGRKVTKSMARVIMGAPDGMEVDHINGNHLDNRRCNLRVCYPYQNKQNSQKSPKAKGSRYKGVRPTYHRWGAQIKSKGKNYYLGYFSTEEEAALAYNKAALNMFGEFAGLNEIGWDNLREYLRFTYSTFQPDDKPNGEGK